MKFSIITPTYNRAHTIGRAIKSLQNQTYSNWEMVIIDDGSTDNTENIVKKIQKQDERIKYIKLTKNRGVNKARNIGFENVSSDANWIGFLDSDDVLLKDALEKMAEKIKKFPNIKHFAFSTIYENGKRGCKIPYDNYIGDYESVLGKHNGEVEGEFNQLLHKSITENDFRFEEIVNGYEWIAWLRLAKSGVKILYTTTTTRIYITDGDSLIRTKNKNKRYWENAKKGLEIILKEFGNDLKRVNKRKYALYLYTLASANIKLNFKKVGINQTLEAAKFDLLNLRLIRNFVNVIK